MTRFVLYACMAFVVVSLIATWAFSPDLPRITDVNRGKAYGSNERILVEGRSKHRRSAFMALDVPWSSRCAAEGRTAFISGLNEYYYRRQNETERYPEAYGKLGADYIARQWSTGDDQRIDRLTQHAYGLGALKPADFEPMARKMVEKVV